MLTTDLAQIIVVLLGLLILVKPVGLYLDHVFSGEMKGPMKFLVPLERSIYRMVGVRAEDDMKWNTYAGAFLAFNALGFIAMFILLRVQGMLPLNPGAVSGMTPEVAFNTAVSFVTNTNWQAYAGETGVSYLSQMLGMTWQNFVSAAGGMAIAVALIRGLTRNECCGVGNFWVDMTRAWLYVLLPGSIVIAIVLLSQGSIQTVESAVVARTVEGATQVIPRGPVASQVAIKMLGTNGGGFFNANSAHPFENPTPFTNLIETLAMLVIPAGMTYMFGRRAGNTRQGWVILSAMMVLFCLGLGITYGSERLGNPALSSVGVSQAAGPDRPGGNMEGKEVRFGIAPSAIFANATTAVSCGAVNGSQSSMTPLAGGVFLLNIALGEVVFGGVGAGMYGMLVFVILAVFIAGLMVGRTPEYLGKKIGPRDMKMVMLALLALEAGILVIAGVGVLTPSVLEATSSVGPHGLTEVLYAATSAVGNNGSAFAGLAADTPWLAVVLGFGMLVGRYLFIVPVMAIAGSMASKRVMATSSGTFPTDGTLFIVLLVGVILIVGALTFFPVLSLGPVLEHLRMLAGSLS